MPQFNTWAPRTGAFVGNQLQTYKKYKPLQPKRKKADYSQEGFLGRDKDRTGTFAHLLATTGRRYGSWYYPSDTVKLYPRAKPRVATRTYTATKTKTKKRKAKKRCCRYIKGKKVCRPEFCGKKKFYYRK